MVQDLLALVLLELHVQAARMRFVAARWLHRGRPWRTA